MVIYKIPNPDSSEPFLLLGSGGHHFHKCGGEIEKIYSCNARSTMKNSEILIVNPTHSDMQITLNMVLTAAENKKTLVISINSEELTVVDIPVTPTNMELENLIIKPGINVVSLDTNQYSTVYYGFAGTEQTQRAHGCGRESFYGSHKGP